MPAPVVASTPAAVLSVTVEACSRMVEAATHSCGAAQPLVATQPNWDAMAVALAQQSNAIASGAVLLTLIIFFAGLAWGKFIVVIAEREAKRCAEQWVKEEGPQILIRQKENISLTTLADGNGKAAEDIGINAGD